MTSVRMRRDKMSIPLVDLKSQYRPMAHEIKAAMERVVVDADFILGRELGLFEEEFARYCGAKFAVGVDSGLSALELSLRAFGIGAGDEVVTVANTFIASASAASFAGATPRLVDIDPATYNMAPDLLEAAITPKTRAIIPVHLYGQPADMDPILEIARKHRLVVIEDACQAHGALYKGRRVGSIGDAGCFSFYPSKNLGAYGDGGMVVTDNAEIAKKLTMMRNYGQSEKNHHVFLAFNRRLDTLQAAVLRVKLGRLDAWNGSRRSRAALYGRLLADCGLALPQVAPYAQHVYHLYVIRHPQRDVLLAHLKEQGIGAGVHYPVPVHLHEAYKDMGYPPGSFPISERYAQEILSLPIYAELSDEQVTYVADCVRGFAR